MKITDYALVFVGVTLPFILVAYINIALTIRTFQQEMYYQKMIDAAVEDSINQMKYIESDEITNSYGYSGAEDNKVSNNPQVAVNTFFNSIYGSLNVLDDKNLQSIINLYVPVIAIMDYNGVYISSVEENTAGDFEHVLKPKRYFSICMAVGENVAYIAKSGGWFKLTYNNDKWVLNEVATAGINESKCVIHNIEFTTDDRIFDTYNGRTDEYFIDDYDFTTNFRYQVDKIIDINNGDYIAIDDDTSTAIAKSPIFTAYNGGVKCYFCTTHEQEKGFVEFFKEYKKKIMIDILTEELSYAANKNNEYARKKHISYNFAFSLEKNDKMYNDVENMGMIALVQGIKVGNRYLNYKAYNYSDLELTHKYYLTVGETKPETNPDDIIDDEDKTQRFGENLHLYHKTDKCIEYINDVKNTAQLYTYTKEAAAELGYMPCPICNP